MSFIYKIFLSEDIKFFKSEFRWKFLMKNDDARRSLAIMAAAIVKICNAPNQVDHLRKVTLTNEIAVLCQIRNAASASEAIIEKKDG